MITLTTDQLLSLGIVCMGITIVHVASQRFIFSPKNISSQKVLSQDYCTQILFELYIGLKIVNLRIISLDDKFQLFFSVKADNRGILYQFRSKSKWKYHPTFPIYLYSYENKTKGYLVEEHERILLKKHLKLCIQQMLF